MLNFVIAINFFLVFLNPALKASDTQTNVRIQARTQCLNLGAESDKYVSFSGVFKSSLSTDSVFVNFHCPYRGDDCYFWQVRWGAIQNLGSGNPSGANFKPKSFIKSKDGALVVWNNMRIETQLSSQTITITLDSLLSKEKEILKLSCE